MKKMLIAGLVLVLAVAMVLPVLADDQTNTYQVPEELKQLQQEFLEKMYRLRIEYIDKRVELGFLTPQQAELLKSRMEQLKDFYLQNESRGYVPGYGFGPGFGHCGYGGFGSRFNRTPGRGFGPRGMMRLYYPGYNPGQ